MRRKITEKMLDWKQKSCGKTALLIDGARRVGKSYAVKEFAEKNYKSYILIDFNEAEPEIRDLFSSGLRDLDSFFSFLSAAYNVKLYERNSLIIFDEVQLCPRARAAIKFLVADGRYDYIETGSLVSIKKNVKDIVIPSEEQHYGLAAVIIRFSMHSLKVELSATKSFSRNQKSFAGNILKNQPLVL